MKYIARAGRKDLTTELEDLQKAQWYVNREIDRLNGVLTRVVPSPFEPVELDLGPALRRARRWDTLADVPEGVSVVDDLGTPWQSGGPGCTTNYDHLGPFTEVLGE